MWKNLGIIENWALVAARYIKSNGGHPDISVGTMRFVLQLWLSVFFIFLFSIVIGLYLGIALQALTVLFIVGSLRYFSGGWHFQSMELCVVLTVSVAIAIPLLPDLNSNVLLIMNTCSLILVIWLSPTGHGQKFKSNIHKMMFKWIATVIVLVSFTYLNPILQYSILCQSLTLITLKGGKGHESQKTI